MNLTHPVPQFSRTNWRDLNGPWQFAFDDEAVGGRAKWANGLPESREIQVPFSYETPASGINEQEHHPIIWYQRTIQLSAAELNQHVYLNFGGVDYACSVFINGQQVATHRGGYTRFTVDITAAVHTGDNRLVVRVTDSKSTEQPRGKQRWRDENFECWYEQTTGIWKPVWLEFTGAVHLTQLKLTPQPAAKALAVLAHLNEPGDYTLTTTVTFQGRPVNQVTTSFVNQQAVQTINVELTGDPAPWGLPYWSPTDPNLFDLAATLRRGDQIVDTVQSYFGMREIQIKDHQILLNGHELYQRLILDQNYWPDSGLTPRSTAEMTKDIQLIKELGYNGARMHMTIADPRFLALADKMGLLIWSEMPATFTFSDQAVTAFTEEWLTIVQQNYNHPAIITWVPFNESWGIPDVAVDPQQQAFTEGIYYLTKAYDAMRPVVTNDGWEHTCSDIITLHDYEGDAKQFSVRYQDQAGLMSGEYQHNKEKYPFAAGFSYHGQPVIISEFGGIAFSDGSGWGYGEQMNSKADFMDRFDAIHQAIQAIPYISGYCYTQLTDVRQEVNGLMTIARQPKLPVAEIKAINERSR